MPDSWNLRTADGVLSRYYGHNHHFEMYVTKGDTWVILTDEWMNDLELVQLDFNTARTRWHNRIKNGWSVDRQSGAWRSLMKNGDR